MPGEERAQGVDKPTARPVSDSVKRKPPRPRSGVDVQVSRSVRQGRVWPGAAAVCDDTHQSCVPCPGMFPCAWAHSLPPAALPGPQGPHGHPAPALPASPGASHCAARGGCRLAHGGMRGTSWLFLLPVTCSDFNTRLGFF